MKERDIERYLVKRVKEMGGEVRKVRWIGRKSAPDRRVMLPQLQVWVELKRPREGATPAQAREHVRMWKMGERVVVINSKEGVDSLLNLRRLEGLKT